MWLASSLRGAGPRSCVGATALGDMHMSGTWGIVLTYDLWLGQCRRVGVPGLRRGRPVHSREPQDAYPGLRLSWFLTDTSRRFSTKVTVMTCPDVYFTDLRSIIVYYTISFLVMALLLAMAPFKRASLRPVAVDRADDGRVETAHLSDISQCGT